MHVFYITAFILLCVGCYLWYKSDNVTWWEWAISGLVGFALAGIFQYTSIKGMTADTETWSGEITYAKKIPRWKEYYEKAIYKTEYYYTGVGKDRERRSRRVFSHWSPRSRWHEERNIAYSNIDTEYAIGADKFEYFVKKFNHRESKKGQRRTSEHDSKMLEGDPNDYYSMNKTRWIEPITKTVSFENRIKATPTVFSFAKLPENVKVHDYPPNNNPFVSDRLMGTAKVFFDQFQFDKLNAELGPIKHVNIIIVGFGDKDTSYGDWQEAKFIGGKKNDLVITFGKATRTSPPQWVKVFGWTENEIVKRNIETLFLTNILSDDIFISLKNEIARNYVIKDWSKFDYITVEPPVWSYFVFFGVILVVQGGLWYIFHTNEASKINSKHYDRYRY